MGNQLREYSGWLEASISLEDQEKLRRLAQESGLELDVADGYFEFEYQGRDSNRFVVTFLARLAEIVGDAQGEVRCEVDSEELDPEFEFYRFEGGKLICQSGKIVRGVEVTIN